MLNMESNICIIWDWNGTLLDDTSACVGALNEMLAARGRAPLTLEYFRENFAFPARQFYERIGMKVEDSEWDALAWEYHERYLHQPSIRLNVEAVAALERVRSLGWRQVMLSALHQRLLEDELARHEIRRYFDHVFGSDNYDGGSKLAQAETLMRTLRAEEKGGCPCRYVLIGDSLHDREIAQALGVECVLVSTGGHSYARLAAVHRTATSLLAAFDLI